MLEQRLLQGQGAARAGAEGEEGSFPLPMAERPARELAGQAGDHGIQRTDLDHPGPARKAGIRGDLDLAEAAHADLGDPPPGLEAAGDIDAPIDDHGACLAMLDAQA